MVSILGTFSILLISELSEVELQEIKDLKKDQLETRIKIQGKLLATRETPGLYILTITDNTAVIPVIIFKEDELELEKNKQFIVTGKLTEYKNELEIIAEEITEND
ncbi:OB-fold nucleic acid binding domain-containing protein [Candidatus Woesearchaeota archaeon]|nr:OB-fold nucleic acid binding domain-containing protein [Candidatus Woesearchaeota archaeon]